MPTWREKVRVGVVVVSILLFAGWYWRYGGPWTLDPQKDAQLANGWVTNCSGPEFGRLPRGENVGLGPERPVFRVTDQLVPAVPKGNWPSAGRLEHQPRECHAISDLPQVNHLYFVIQGNWTGSYNPNDIPSAGGKKEFLPDAVTVRIEPLPPNKFSIEEQREVDQRVAKHWNDLANKHEIGGLICGRDYIPPDPSRKGGWTCHGQRTPSDPDIIKLDTKSYRSPFVLIDADYESSHYGGIHVYWMVWTSDVVHARDIDQAIWKSLAEWNLVNEPRSSPELSHK